MSRICFAFALAAILGVYCLGNCAQHAGESSAGAPPIAGQIGSGAVPSQRVTGAVAALSIAIDAAEQSRPKRPSKTWGRLFGLAVAVLAAANSDSPFQTPGVGGQAAEWMFYGGPEREVGLRDAFSDLLRFESEEGIYGTLMGEVDALAQADAKTAYQLSMSVKDPYWQARALVHTGSTQIRLGNTEVGVDMLLRAIAFAQQSSIVLVKGTVANRALHSALSLREGDPEAAARLRQACEPLVLSLPLTSPEPRAPSEWAGVMANYATFLALSDRNQAQDYLSRIPDLPARLMVAFTVAMRIGPGASPLKTEAAPDLGTAGNLREKRDVLLDYGVATETRTTAYELAGMPQPQDANATALPIAAEFLNMSLENGDLQTVSTIVGWLAEGDREKAKAVIQDRFVPRVTTAIEGSLRDLRQREQGSYSVSRNDDLLTAFKGVPDVEESPVWSGYLADVALLLGYWTTMIRDLASVDPKLAELAVGSAADPVITAFGAVALVTPEADVSLRDRMSKTVMSAWEEIKEPEAKGLTRLLLRDGNYGRRHSAMVSFFASELATRLARGDVGNACTLLRSAKQPYTTFRRMACNVATAAPDQALALPDLWTDESTRAGAERYLASLVVERDVERAIAMYQKADGIAQRRFTGRTRPGFLVRRKVDPVEKQSDVTARAEDLAAMLRALAAKAPDRAGTFVSSLSDPYQRCQSLRLLALLDQSRAPSLSDEAASRLADVKDSTYRSQATCDLAVATAKYDTPRGTALAKEIKDPAHRAWATTMIATRLATDPAQEEALLKAAQVDLPQIREPKRRAYVGYVLARAWLGMDREQVLADLDAPRFGAVPW